MKWQQLDKKHKALIKSTQTNKSEVDALNKTNARLRNERQEYKVKWEKSQNRHNGLAERFRKVQTENKELKSENARLRAELEELRPPKKKVIKKVIKG